MIVKCEQCQTRFKIPDEKVTEKGVKVRCTKCQHTFRVTRDGTPVAAVGQIPSALKQPPAKPPDDPFAKFGMPTEDPLGEATRPAVYALGVEASRQSTPLQPSFAAQRDLPAQIFAQPTRVGAVPSLPVEAPSSPFDFAAALDSAEAPNSTPFDFGEPAPPPVADPFGVGEEAAQLDPFAAATVAPDLDPFADMDLGLNAEAQMPAPAVTQPEVPSVFGPDNSDFFEDTQNTAAPAHSPVQLQSIRPDELGLSEGGEVEADTSQRAALFEMPPTEPNKLPEGLDLRDSSESAVPIGKLKLVRGPVKDPVIEDDVPSIRPKSKVSSLVLNLSIASALVVLLTAIVTVYLSEGKVELASFSVDRLSATFSPSTVWVALDVSNGLYDTRSGRPVFFVRGEVKNRGDKSARAKVRAEILDGNTSIRHADVWVGVAPTPEDLYLISVADDVDRLMVKLEKSATEVMPGEKRSFLVPFYEYPPELKDFRVRVTVLDSGQTETAVR